MVTIDLTFGKGGRTIEIPTGKGMKEISIEGLPTDLSEFLTNIVAGGAGGGLGVGKPAVSKATEDLAGSVYRGTIVEGKDVIRGIDKNLYDRIVQVTGNKDIANNYARRGYQAKFVQKDNNAYQAVVKEAETLVTPQRPRSIESTVRGTVKSSVQSKTVMQEPWTRKEKLFAVLGISSTVGMASGIYTTIKNPSFILEETDQRIGWSIGIDMATNTPESLEHARFSIQERENLLRSGLVKFSEIFPEYKEYFASAMTEVQSQKLKLEGLTQTTMSYEQLLELGRKLGIPMVQGQSLKDYQKMLADFQTRQRIETEKGVEKQDLTKVQFETARDERGISPGKEKEYIRNNPGDYDFARFYSAVQESLARPAQTTPEIEQTRLDKSIEEEKIKGTGGDIKLKESASGGFPEQSTIKSVSAALGISEADIQKHTLPYGKPIIPTEVGVGRRLAARPLLPQINNEKILSDYGQFPLGITKEMLDKPTPPATSVEELDEFGRPKKRIPQPY